MRLRQIVNNLASNACKFTPSGGHIKLSTRLIYPVVPGSELIGDATESKLLSESSKPTDELAEKTEDLSAKATSSERQVDNRNKRVQLESSASGEAPKTRLERKSSLSIWRRLSGRRRRNRPIPDALDKAEKGVSVQVKSPAAHALSMAQLIRHDSVDPSAMDHIIVSRFKLVFLCNFH